MRGWVMGEVRREGKVGACVGGGLGEGVCAGDRWLGVGGLGAARGSPGEAVMFLLRACPAQAGGGFD